MFSVNSGQRGLTGKTVCPLESLTGMSFAVRFMTAVEKYALTIGACIASGKHAGFPVIPATIAYCGNQTGRVYGKSLPCMEQKELFGTGLVQWIRTHPVTDPEKYLAVWKRMPKMEQIWKAGLPRLTKECFEHCDSVRERILYPNEPRLIRALGLDGPKFCRLAVCGR